MAVANAASRPFQALAGWTGEADGGYGSWSSCRSRGACFPAPAVPGAPRSDPGGRGESDDEGDTGPGEGADETVMKGQPGSWNSGSLDSASRSAASRTSRASRRARGAVEAGETRVREIMSEQIVTVSADDSLSTVEDIMTLGGVRHMPVVRSGTLVGVVSERDLLRASLSSLTGFANEERRAFLQVVEIKRVMSSPPIVIAPDASVVEAALVMAERKIGCLPVVVHGRLVGLITETDVLRYFAGVLS